MNCVTPARAGYLPLMTLARVGEHTGHDEYASVKSIPSLAKRSRFGVS